MRPNKNLAQNADSDFLHFALDRRMKRSNRNISSPLFPAKAGIQGDALGACAFWTPTFVGAIRQESVAMQIERLTV
jgi:hypothetical protein